MSNTAGTLEVVSYLFLGLVLYLAFVSLRFCRRLAKFDSYYDKSWMVILGWIVLVSVLGLVGFLSDFEATPPRMIFLLAPTLGFHLYLASSQRLEPLLEHLSLSALTYIQAFRIVMEIVLWLLVEEQALPQTMTFTGRNFDIVIGLTAPIVGYQLRYGQTSAWSILKMWNVAGILILASTVIHGLLSAPTVFRLFDEGISTELIGNFPYALLPGFVVPFAFACHILSLRKISRAEVKTEEGACV